MMGSLTLSPSSAFEHAAALLQVALDPKETQKRLEAMGAVQKEIEAKLAEIMSREAAVKAGEQGLVDGNVQLSKDRMALDRAATTRDAKARKLSDDIAAWKKDVAERKAELDAMAAGLAAEKTALDNYRAMLDADAAKVRQIAEDVEAEKLTIAEGEKQLAANTAALNERIGKAMQAAKQLQGA